MYLYIYYIYVARIFSNIFRFMDGLCTFNKEVKENEDPCKTSFLDLSIKVRDKKFTTKLFDERDVFPFHINRMPYLNYNIPYKIFYASVDPEISLIARITTDGNTS